MRVWGLAFFLLALGLPAIGQQETSPPSPTRPPATTSSEQSSPPAANETSKPEKGPKIDLTPDADGTLWELTLREFLRSRIARYKQPRHWRALPALPKTALGKVQKQQLASQLLSNR